MLLTLAGSFAHAGKEPVLECKIGSLVVGDKEDSIQPGRMMTVRSHFEADGKCPQVIQKDMAFSICVSPEEFVGGYDVIVKARTLLEDSDKDNYGGATMMYGTSVSRKGELIPLQGSNSLIVKQIRNLGTHGLGYFSGDIEVVEDSYIAGDLNNAVSKALDMGILKPGEPLTYVIKSCRLVN
jgi:hypothetical protein